jgi:hypothetical protein
METLTEKKHVGGTFANPGPGFQSGPDSNLYPFRLSSQPDPNNPDKTVDKFWTPQDVMAITFRAGDGTITTPADDTITGRLGYLYPELRGVLNREKLAAKVCAAQVICPTTVLALHGMGRVAAVFERPAVTLQSCRVLCLWLEF